MGNQIFMYYFNFIDGLLQSSGILLIKVHRFDLFLTQNQLSISKADSEESILHENCQDCFLNWCNYTACITVDTQFKNIFIISWTKK